MSTQCQFPVLLNVDIEETQNAYSVEADVAGFLVESLNVYTWQDSLVIEMHSGHVPGQSYYLGELEPETYRRVIPLGFEISDEAVQTEFTDGKLKIGVVKPASAKMFKTSRTVSA